MIYIYTHNSTHTGYTLHIPTGMHIQGGYPLMVMVGDPFANLENETVDIFSCLIQNPHEAGRSALGVLRMKIAHSENDFRTNVWMTYVSDLPWFLLFHINMYNHIIIYIWPYLVRTRSVPGPKVPTCWDRWAISVGPWPLPSLAHQVVAVNIASAIRSWWTGNTSMRRQFTGLCSGNGDFSTYFKHQNCWLDESKQWVYPTKVRICTTKGVY